MTAVSLASGLISPIGRTVRAAHVERLEFGDTFAISVAAPETRELVAASRSLVAEERFDILVHALAQLSDEVRLAVHGRGPDRPRLERLARAYALGGRIRFIDAPPEPSGALGVYPSPANAAGAPLSGEGRRVVFDPSGRSGPATMAELLEELGGSSGPASCRERDAALSGHRVAVITNHAAPYRIPLFNGLAARLDAAGAHLRVFFAAGGAAGRPWLRPWEELGFESRTLRSVSLPGRERPTQLPLDLEVALARFAPTIIACGGFTPTYSARAAAYAAGRRIPFGVWSGEIEGTASARSRLRRPLRAWLLRRASFGLAYGHASTEYLHRQRPQLPVVQVRNTSWEGLGDVASRPEARRPVELMTVGDLASPRKGVDVLIEALELVPDLPCHLSIVGGGTLADSLKTQARKDPRVTFTGPLPRPEVFAAYERADAFLFPTRSDVFGLVLPEAMGSGMACAVSPAPGALPDLCVPGRNALLVDGHEPAVWAEAITRLVEDDELRARLGREAARTIARRWTMAHSVDAWMAGLRLGVESVGTAPP